MKTYAQFIETYTGNADSAPDAYAAYVRSASQNEQPRGRQATQEDARNRIIANAAIQLLSRQLGIDLPDRGDDQLSPREFDTQLAEAFTRAKTQITGATESVDTLRGAVSAAGLDLAAYDAADSVKKAELLREWQATVTAGSKEASELRAQLNLRDAAAELGVDPVKLANLKGTDAIKRGKVKIKKIGADGAETEEEQDAWVLDDGTTTLAQYISKAGFTVEQLAPAPRENAEPEQEQGGASVTAGQPAPKGKSGNDTSWLG